MAMDAEAPPDSRKAWHLLRGKTRKFVDHYAKNGMIADAERAAGWSPKSRMGSKALKKPLVRMAVEATRRDLYQMGLLDATQITNELKTIAFLPPEELRDQASHADKLRALEMLGKSQGMFVDRVQVSGQITLSQLVRASFAPRDQPVIDVPALDAPSE